jgi:arylsulfatase A-like enzyme
VPGVFWCNRPIDKADPELLDLAPTVLDLFGVEIPAYMQGSPLFGGASATAGRPAQEEASEPTRAGAAPREPEEAR